MEKFLYSLLFFSIFFIFAYMFRKKLRGMKDPSLFCPHHPNTIPTHACQICDKTFCGDCVKKVDTLVLCNQHFAVYKSHKFKLYKSVVSNPLNPQEGVELYEYRENLKKEGILSYFKIEYSEGGDGEITTTTHLFIKDN